jgi:hypothetical protein
MEILANRGLRRSRQPSVAEPSATLAGQPAAWVEVVRRRLEALGRLGEGWDGRSAPRVAPANIGIAMQLLQRVMRTGTPVPEIVPTLRGGLQIEWHVPDVDVELEIATPSRYVLSFEDRSTDQEFERQLSTDLTPFAQAVETISGR